MLFFKMQVAAQSLQSHHFIKANQSIINTYYLIYTYIFQYFGKCIEKKALAITISYLREWREEVQGVDHFFFYTCDFGLMGPFKYMSSLRHVFLCFFEYQTQKFICFSLQCSNNIQPLPQSQCLWSSRVSWTLDLIDSLSNQDLDLSFLQALPAFHFSHKKK